MLVVKYLINFSFNFQKIGVELGTMTASVKWNNLRAKASINILRKLNHQPPSVNPDFRCFLLRSVFVKRGSPRRRLYRVHPTHSSFDCNRLQSSSFQTPSVRAFSMRLHGFKFWQVLLDSTLVVGSMSGPLFFLKQAIGEVMLRGAQLKYFSGWELINPLSFVMNSQGPCHVGHTSYHSINEVK